MAPRTGTTRSSRAKERNDRNIKPPAPKYAPASKRKQRGASKMPPSVSAVASKEESLTVAPTTTAPPTLVDLDDLPENKDSWWTDEREKALVIALQGIGQAQIARELGRERHTIARWMEDPRFEQRMYDENVQRFRTSRQRRTVQTLRLTDKAHDIADKMLDSAKKKPKDLASRLAARDWLNEFREQSRREDEIYGLDKQRVDVNVHGTVNHKHKGAVVSLSFKDFLKGSMEKLGIDVDSEEIDATRADDAIMAVAERALAEGSFLEELVEGERQERLAPTLDGDR